MTYLHRATAAAGLLLFTMAYGQTVDEIAAAKAQKDMLEAQVAIEKAKGDLAEQKVRQLKADWLGSATAEEAKKKAEAEKAELAAKFPSTDAKALPGTIGTEGVKLLAFPPVIEKMKTLAGKVCDKLPGPFAVYDGQTFQAVTAATVLESQIDLLRKAHESVGQDPTAKAAGPRVAAFLALGAVTSAVKTAADLASLFKTDIVTGRNELTEARAYFLAMMAGQCGERMKFIPASYLGELDRARYDALAAKVKALLEANYTSARNLDGKKGEIAEQKQQQKEAQDKIAALEKKGDKISAGERKELDTAKQTVQQLAVAIRSLTTLTAALEDLVKQTDTLILALKINDAGGGGPLQNAARLLRLAERLAAPDTAVLDLDVKAEGVTILKNNLFTGQDLRIAGAILLSYKIFDKAGKVTSADALAERTEFQELDLRGKN